MVAELHGDQRSDDLRLGCAPASPGPAPLPDGKLLRLPTEDSSLVAATLPERLLAIVGHELRSPLSAITMAATTMGERGQLGDRDRNNLTVIQRNAGRMAHLIQQLVDFTRMRMEGGYVLEREEADLAEIGRDLVAEFELSHRDRVFQLGCQGVAVGRWDRLRLGEVLSNLLSNAVQYGEAGRPVSVRIDGTGEPVELAVHNHGAPIPPESLSFIFDPFRRATRDRRDPAAERSSPSGNLGLGLYIIREIITAHGGTIDVTSTAANGTTFAVHLPRG